MKTPVTRPDVPVSATNPKHYRSHESGVECIELTELLPFCVGNAVKYIWRADLKNGREDLAKALWYTKRAAADGSFLGYRDGERVYRLLVRWSAAEPVSWRRVAVDALVRAVLAPVREHAVLALGEAQSVLELALSEPVDGSHGT